jgi:hypothetical protein
MEPNVEITVGAGSGAGRRQRPRPSLLVRGMEIAGLVLVGYGLASNAFLLAGAGAGLILLSYRIYRRKHGAGPGVDGNGSVDGGDLGGGGD